MTTEETIYKEIEAIKNRNLRVEADKAWETSKTRILSIAGITYIVAAMVMATLGANKPLLNAFIPTIGFLLSTQSLPAIKKWWITKRIDEKPKL